VVVPVNAAEAVGSAPPATEPVNILVVDDEAKNLTVLETVLDDPGYRLVKASSGEEALLALMATDFAVLVLDIHMPDMNGFELAQMIKLRRKTAQLPIIFLTAYYNEDQHVLEGYGSGAVDYLHKPVNAGVLRSKVGVFAELHRKGRALELANRALQAEVAERRSAQARLQELNQTLDRRITERTEALRASDAQLREVNRRKDEFLATLAHELRNPLAPVSHAVQLLRRLGRQTPELDWASAVIERQVRAMSRLIDDLMDVTRIDQGKIDLQCRRVELADVMHDAVETVRPLIDEFGHALHLDVPSRGLLLRADRTRLAQAFTNLLNNAAKYTNLHGRIDVLAQAEGDEVRVCIRDNGIGIAADRLESVFELFSQVESALERSRGGLGIGLALTRQLIRMHGGSVVARSAGAGHGSEFVVRLKLCDARAGDQAADVAQDSAQLAQPGPDDALASAASAPGAVDAVVAVAEVAEVAAVAESAESAEIAEIAEIAKPPDAGAAATVPEAAGEPRRLRILVADDNEDAADTLSMLLELMGHTVRCVNDGASAVAEAEAFVPDVALLDLGMPTVSGYDACRRMRAAPWGARMLLVAVSGWGQAEDRRRSRDAGFDQHLVTPLDATALEAVLANPALGRR
jgi:signal transduction histidine kinase